MQGIIHLGESLKLDVIAEGIEHAQQADRLKAMHAPLGQGFLFSRPVSPDAILTLCNRQKHRPVALTNEPDESPT